MHRMLLTFGMVTLTLWTPDRAAAQEAAVRVDHGLTVLGVGGVTRSGGAEAPHAAAGALVRLERSGWGVLGLGMAGRGGEYTSLLTGGAVSRTLVGGERLGVAAFGGYGRYGEEGATGIRRDAAGVLYGGIATYRAGPLKIALVASDLTGRYDGADVSRGFSFHVPRVSLGVGF
jgi:hypothetical protein